MAYDFQCSIYSKTYNGRDNYLYIPRLLDKFADNEQLVDNLTHNWGGDTKYINKVKECVHCLKETIYDNDPYEILRIMSSDEKKYSYIDDYLLREDLSKAVFEICVFPKNLEVTKNNFDKSIRDKFYTFRMFIPVDYDNDERNFRSKDSKTKFTHISDSVWKLVHFNLESQLLSYLLERGQVWIRMFSERAYKYYISAKNVIRIFLTLT